MSYDYQPYVSDSDEEQQDPLWERWAANKYVTCVILDNSSSMFDTVDENDNCLFKLCLRACLQTLEKYVFRTYGYTFALTLLSGKQTPIVDFGTNLLDAIKKLMTLTKESNDELKSMFESQVSQQAFYDGITNCVGLYKKGEKYMKKAKKHIALLTNVASPDGCDKNDEDLERAMEKLQHLEIEFLVIPLAEDFNWDIFYKDLINKAVEEASEIIEEFSENAYDDEDVLTQVLYNLTHARKSVRRGVFTWLPKDTVQGEFNDSEFFYVQVRKFVKIKKILRNCLLDPETEQECVRVKEKVYPEDSQKEGESSEPKDALTVSSSQFRKFLVNLRCIGFKLLYLSEKRSSLHYLKSSQFMVQKDEVIPQEDKKNYKHIYEYHLFDTFWQYCWDKGLCMICVYIVNTRQQHHLVELSPDRYKGKPCFIGQQLISMENTKPHRVRKEFQSLPSEKGIDLKAATELIDKITIRNPDKLYELVDPEFEKKGDILRGMLFSRAVPDWEPTSIPVFWPTSQQISQKLGQNIRDNFIHNYLSAIKKRKGATGSGKQSKKQRN